MSTSLQSLPPELLRKILLHSDYASVAALSETCKHLHAEATNETVWRQLAHRRFRVSQETTKSRRLRAAGPISWRTLYANWHMQRRMPVSRRSGPTFRPFARGAAHGAMVWVTVPSADDCRLRDGMLRLTLIVQNLRSSRLWLTPGSVSVVMAGGVLPDVRVAACEHAESRAKFLCRDDFALLSVYVHIPGAAFEVDALERLVEMRVGVDGDRSGCIVARFVEKEIWDAYDLLPGGWWVRIN